MVISKFPLTYLRIRCILWVLLFTLLQYYIYYTTIYILRDIREHSKIVRYSRYITNAYLRRYIEDMEEEGVGGVIGTKGMLLVWNSGLVWKTGSMVEGAEYNIIDGRAFSYALEPYSSSSVAYANPSSSSILFTIILDILLQPKSLNPIDTIRFRVLSKVKENQRKIEDIIRGVYREIEDIHIEFSHIITVLSSYYWIVGIAITVFTAGLSYLSSI